MTDLSFSAAAMPVFNGNHRKEPTAHKEGKVLNGTDVITISNIIWGLCGLLIGGLVTHYFTLFRDKRKEFNEVADRMDLVLERESRSGKPRRHGPTPDDVRMLKRRMSTRQQRRFQSALEEYQTAKHRNRSEPGSRGQIHYISFDEIQASITKLQRFLQRR